MRPSLATPGEVGSPLNEAAADPYPHAAGGWGSIGEVIRYVAREGHIGATAAALRVQNKPGGFACVSCAWAKPGKPQLAEFCESGAKATAWELTSKTIAADFFAAHYLAELRTWSDHELESAGRLTVPLRWDAATDRYEEIGWDTAFEEVGALLRRQRDLDPKAVVFYASGRASLEASYLYQLLARLYGNNNLPDSSNMCHESTSVALPKTIGVPVGTVTLADFDTTDAIFFFGQNVGVSSPRMLHQLQQVRERGKPIVTFNPLRERGLIEFANPQSPTDMLTPSTTQISTQYLQLRVGGDLAAITGLCKAVLAADHRALVAGRPRVIDAEFIAVHTAGFEDFKRFVESTSWEEIERESGLGRADLEEAAATFASARSVIGVYGMGLTQHRKGVQNVQMVSNLLLLGGHIGRAGAGICPVRGHSNVQGQRTVGITEKPELAPLDKLAELYRFEPPREKGMTTVETCRGVIDGRVKGFVGLGGNFIRAAPDTDRIEAAWPALDFSVQIATKLNRSHLVHGRAAYLLPCLGRIEVDRQAGIEQTVSVEDSTGWMHASKGVAEPAAPTLRSEIDIVARIAQASLPANASVPWQHWTSDYASVRDAIAQTWPEIFHDFNRRLTQPEGFPKPNAARERIWKTPNGRANFIVPDGFTADPDTPEVSADVLRLTTLRSDSQFNTTIYSLDDRFRGIQGSRQVLLVNADDASRLGLQEGDLVDVVTAVRDGFPRIARAFKLVTYSIPRGCVAGYFPELNALVPLDHHAEESQVPATKSIPVRLEKSSTPTIHGVHLQGAGT